MRDYYTTDDNADDHMSEAKIRPLFYQMAQAIVACHKVNIIHRDVKLENFLIKEAPNGELIVKLTDFGIACPFEKDKKIQERCGSLLGVAPEIFTQDDICPKIDCWSLGVILYELLTTLHPFFDSTTNESMKNILY